MTQWNEDRDESGLGGIPSTNAASDGPGGAPTPDAVSVEIYDQIYNLRGTDDAYIQQIAALVDAKMRAVAAHGGTADSLRVAVLAALNIADDLTTLRARYDALAGSRAAPKTPCAPAPTPSPRCSTSSSKTAAPASRALPNEGRNYPQRLFSPSRLKKKLPKITSTPSINSVAEGSVSRSIRVGDSAPKPAACHRKIA